MNQATIAPTLPSDIHKLSHKLSHRGLHSEFLQTSSWRLRNSRRRSLQHTALASHHIQRVHPSQNSRKPAARAQFSQKLLQRPLHPLSVLFYATKDTKTICQSSRPKAQSKATPGSTTTPSWRSSTNSIKNRRSTTPTTSLTTPTTQTSQTLMRRMNQNPNQTSHLSPTQTIPRAHLSRINTRSPSTTAQRATLPSSSPSCASHNSTIQEWTSSAHSTTSPTSDPRNSSPASLPWRQETSHPLHSSTRLKFALTRRTKAAKTWKKSMLRSYPPPRRAPRYRVLGVRPRLQARESAWECVRDALFGGGLEAVWAG
jgi:hypothetical protein